MNIVLDAISHIRKIWKKKPTTEKILGFINNNCASNYDIDMVNEEIEELIKNGYIDREFKVLKKSQFDGIPNLDVSSEDVDIIFSNHVKTSEPKFHRKALFQESESPFPDSKIRSTPSNIGCANEINELTANIMAVKSFFMKEMYILKDEILSLKLQIAEERNIKMSKNEIESRYPPVKDFGNRIKQLENENQFLREEVSNKQKIIEIILEHSSNLIKFKENDEKAKVLNRTINPVNVKSKEKLQSLNSNSVPNKTVIKKTTQEIVDLNLKKAPDNSDNQGKTESREKEASDIENKVKRQVKEKKKFVALVIQ